MFVYKKKLFVVVMNFPLYTTSLHEVIVLRPLQNWAWFLKRLIRVNTGFNLWSVLVFYLPMHYCMFLMVKTHQYFIASNCMFLDEKTVFKIWLNPGLNLTIFRGTGPTVTYGENKMIDCAKSALHKEIC